MGKNFRLCWIWRQLSRSWWRIAWMQGQQTSKFGWKNMVQCLSKLLTMALAYHLTIIRSHLLSFVWSLFSWSLVFGFLMRMEIAPTRPPTPDSYWNCTPSLWKCWAIWQVDGILGFRVQAGFRVCGRKHVQWHVLRTFIWDCRGWHWSTIRQKFRSFQTCNRSHRLGSVERLWVLFVHCPMWVWQPVQKRKQLGHAWTMTTLVPSPLNKVLPEQLGRQLQLQNSLLPCLCAIRNLHAISAASMGDYYLFCRFCCLSPHRAFGP